MSARNDWLSITLEKGSILAAVSGGADSVYLLHHLMEGLAGRGVRVAVAHVNHRMRGAESDGDEDFVQQLATRLGVEFFAQRIDPGLLLAKGPRTGENALRELRLGLLKGLARQLGIDVIAFGHHAGDLAESFLLAALRGSGPAGLEALREVRELEGGLYAVRPLLGMTREEIVERLTARGEAWREDASNADEAYRRNAIRRRVLPVLREIEPGAIEALATSAEIAGEVEAHHAEAVAAVCRDIFLAETPGVLLFSAESLRRHPGYLHPGVIRQFTSRLAAREQTTTPTLPNRDALRRARERIANDAGDEASFQLTGQISLWLSNRYGLVYRDKQLAEAFLGVCGAFPFLLTAGAQALPIGAPESPIRVENGKGEPPVADKNPNEAIAHLDADAVRGKLMLRRADPNERMPLRGGGTKAVGEALAEAGVPTAIRDAVLCVADDDGLLWIPGVRRAGRAWIEADTKRWLALIWKRTGT